MLVLAGTRRTVPLLGVDMLSESAATETANNASANNGRIFQRDESIWVGSGLGYKAGDRLKLLINDQFSDYTVRGVLGDRSGEVP